MRQGRKHLREPRMNGVRTENFQKEDPNKPPTHSNMFMAPTYGPVALRLAIALRRGDFHLEVGGEKKRVWSGDKGGDKSLKSEAA